MKIYVQKYGGTSLIDAKCINRVAKRIQRDYLKGHRIVVILSAMGHSTDNLVQLAESINAMPSDREMDMLLSTGEQVSVALMAIALSALQIPAISFTGSQVGILVGGYHSRARILKVNTRKIYKELDENKVCLITGFQGIDERNEIYTLGRGGSDISAVAIAASLKANLCEIYTDVDGVYTTDPNKIPTAQKIDKISYEEMLELARLGAGVLHSRSVELASKYGLTLQVSSSFNHVEGTLVMPEDKILEKALVRGVSLKMDEARVSVVDIGDSPGLAAKLFSKLSEKNINVNIIVQSTGKDNLNTISFTVFQKQLDTTKALIQDFIQEEGTGRIEITPEIAILSAVGSGMKSHSGVASAMFKALAEIKVNIEMISTSEIKISVVLSPSEGIKALEVVHKAFGLDQKSG